MSRSRKVTVIGTTVLGVALWASGPAIIPGGIQPVWAEDTLDVENIPDDPKALRVKVEKTVGKVDGLINKLKSDPEKAHLVMDLQMTRDNLMRELPKVESGPNGSKWLASDMKESVTSMMKLLALQYEKAQGGGE